MKTITSKLNAVAAVLALVGAGVGFYTHMMSDANALSNPMMVILAGVAAAVLAGATIVVKNDLVGLVGVLGAIACNMFVVFQIVSERILMIAGIFSYNSQDTVGWSVFYVLVASAVILVLSNVAMIVGSFLSKE